MAGWRGWVATAWLLASLGLTAGQVHAETPADSRDSRYDIAVIIGNKGYKHAPNVKYAHADADAMRGYAREVLGIREGNILDLRDASLTELRTVFGTGKDAQGALHWTVKPGQSEVLVFYSGHGVPEVGRGGAQGYLLPVDARPEKPSLGGYPLAQLYANLEKLPATRVTVLLDACFSGLSQGGALVPETSGTFGVAVAAPEPKAQVATLTATAFDKAQFAHWLPEKGHGAFTYYALKALYGAADTERYGTPDGQVTLREVHAYLNDEMRYTVRRTYQRDQSPSLSGPRDMNLTLTRKLEDVPERPFGSDTQTASRTDGPDGQQGSPPAGSAQSDQDTRPDPKLVRQIQEELNRLGYDAGPVDGLMGPKTTSALKASGQISKQQNIPENLKTVLRALSKTTSGENSEAKRNAFKMPEYVTANYVKSLENEWVKNVDDWLIMLYSKRVIFRASIKNVNTSGFAFFYISASNTYNQKTGKGSLDSIEILLVPKINMENQLIKINGIYIDLKKRETRISNDDGVSSIYISDVSLDELKHILGDGSPMYVEYFSEKNDIIVKKIPSKSSSGVLQELDFYRKTDWGLYVD